MRGRARHLVRFLASGGVLYALKELPLGPARREYRALLHLENLRLPTVEAAGVAEEPATDQTLLMSAPMVQWPGCTSATTPSVMRIPMPLKKKNNRVSRPQWLPLRCRNAQNLLPTKAKHVARTLASVADQIGPSPKPEWKTLTRTMVRTNASPPTTPNLATSWISTWKRW